MGGFRYHYDIPETTAVYRFGLYELKRIKPVLDSNGTKSSMIGIEWDNTFTLKMAGHANVDLDFNAFQPARAYRKERYDFSLCRTFDLLFLNCRF